LGVSLRDHYARDRLTRAMAGGAAARLAAPASGALLLLAAAALLAARAGVPAAGRGERVAPAGGFEQVAQAKKLVETRGRTLARRLRSLTRAVDDDEHALKESGLHVRLSQLQGFKLDVGDLKSAFARVSTKVKIPAQEAAAKGGAHARRLPAAVREKQKKLLDKALALADSAIEDDSKAAAKRAAWQKDEAAYKQALVAAAQSHASLRRAEAKLHKRKTEGVLLVKEKALLKARERREALQRVATARRDTADAADRSLQRKIDSTIAHALADAKRELARKAHARSKTPSKAVVMQWAAAAKAAKRGDSGAVHAFCSAQAHSKDCVSVLQHHAASKKPCNPEKPGYFQCLGVENTGGTL